MTVTARHTTEIPHDFFVHTELYQLSKKTKLPIHNVMLGLLFICDDDGWFEWHPAGIRKALHNTLIRKDPGQAMALMRQAGMLEYHRDYPHRAFGRVPERYRKPGHTKATTKKPLPIESVEALMCHAVFKAIATEFYYWWHNQPGTNTEQGFDQWWEEEGKNLRSPIKAPSKE